MAKDDDSINSSQKLTNSSTHETIDFKNVFPDIEILNCRYCFKKLTKDQNVSSCNCNSALCKKCLLQEVILTGTRGNRKIMCTACNKEYDVKETDNTPLPAKCRDFVVYMLYYTIPFGECFQRFWYSESAPTPSGYTMSMTCVLTVWMAFTISMDYFFGMKISSLFRAFVFFVDVLAILLMYNLTHSCRSRRWKNGLLVYFMFLHLLRVSLLTIYAVSLYEDNDFTISYVQEQMTDQDVENAKKNEIFFSLQWLIFTSIGNNLVSSIFYWVDIVSEFISDYSRAKTVMVGKHGPFQIMNELNE